MDGKRRKSASTGLNPNSPVNKQSSSEFLNSFHLTACVLLLLQGFSMTLQITPFPSEPTFILSINARRPTKKALLLLLPLPGLGAVTSLGLPGTLLRSLPPLLLVMTSARFSFFFPLLLKSEAPVVPPRVSVFSATVSPSSHTSACLLVFLFPSPPPPSPIC